MFQPETPEIRFRIVGQGSLPVAALFPDATAIRQQMLPGADFEYALIEVSAALKRMCAPQKAHGRKEAIRNPQADIGEKHRNGCPDRKKEKDYDRRAEDNKIMSMMPANAVFKISILKKY